MTRQADPLAKPEKDFYNVEKKGKDSRNGAYYEM